MNGVSTRKVDRLVEQLGIQGMTKDRVSALCRALDEQVEAFLERPLEGDLPVPVAGRQACQGARLRPRPLEGARDRLRRARDGQARGDRPRPGRGRVGGVLGRASCATCAAAACRACASCVSDQHEGLQAAIARVLACPWQRCTVHFVRNMHQHCRPAQRGLVSAALREVFNADSPRAGQGAGRRGDRTPRARRCRRSPPCSRRPKTTCSPSTPSPHAHWSKLRSTNPLERVNREIGRRYRRRRHLPQRPLSDPPRRRAADRTERRMARQPPLPLSRIARARPRRGRARPEREGGDRAHPGLSRREGRRVGVTPLRTT